MSPAAGLLAAAITRLRGAGIDSAQVDAELLLAHCLDVARSRLYLVDELESPLAQRFLQLVARRESREPLQHITGEAPFRHLVLAVGPGVFVPRPETELLVDAVLPELAGAREPVVVDLCSGSGALAVSIAHELPGARVYAIEHSPQALQWLRRNCAGTSVRVVEGDVADPAVLALLNGRADAVVGNPPYVPSSAAVSAEVGQDPAVAVFAGADGLALMPAVFEAAARLLRVGGVLAVEHDDTHAEAVPVLLRAAGRWTQVLGHTDLTGRPRYVTATRR